MADNAKTVNIGFGAGFTEEVYTRTGSLWDYRYIDGLGQYSGSIDPIFGPGCRIDAGEYGCYAAPTGHAGPEGSVIYDYVTLKPGMDTYVYLDVGFWGRSDKRSFGVVCGPHVWLCNYGQGGGAPERGDGYANILFNFHREMGNFRVVQQATLPFDKAGDWGAGTARIYLILPDMHMWPNPEELKKRRKEFFTEDELKALDRGVNNGKVIRNSAGSLDVPVKQDETPGDHALRLVGTPEGRAAMKENALSDSRKMREEEEKHAFGSSAGADLVKLLDALQRARDKQFDVMLIHVGDLLEMWSPYHTWVGPQPFKYEYWKGLQLTDMANQRIPKWLEIIYNYSHNRAALQALDNAACYQIYGNHDVYLAFNKWNLSDIGTMDRLRNSLGFFEDTDLLWVEHGHRFDPSNRDGYWMWIDVGKPPGPVINTAVNYYPDLRNLGDKFDNPDENLYKKNVPYATIWYLLSRYASVDKSLGLRLPPKFRIFCQGHTHSPVLLKVRVAWSKLKGHYEGKSIEEQVMKEEQHREQGARDGSYTPVTTEDAAVGVEQWREQKVREQRARGK